jgi:hypothetical protein
MPSAPITAASALNTFMVACTRWGASYASQILKISLMGKRYGGASARVYNVPPLDAADHTARHGLPLDARNSEPMAASNSCVSNGFSKSSENHIRT